MLFSRKGRYFTFLVLLGVVGCATSNYRTLYKDDSAAEFGVTPDRVILECEPLHDADIKGLYGFMIHILDETQTALTLVQSNTLDREGCEDRLKKIGKILKTGRTIYVAGRGDLDDVSSASSQIYDFPGTGKIKGNGRSLGFVAISNEYGLCYAAHGGFEDKPCPPPPFPLWKKK